MIMFPSLLFAVDLNGGFCSFFLVEESVLNGQPNAYGCFFIFYGCDSMSSNCFCQPFRQKAKSQENPLCRSTVNLM